jgi:hypothetical protein
LNQSVLVKIDGAPMKLANYIEYVDDQDAIAAIRPTHRAYLAGLLGTR